MNTTPSWIDMPELKESIDERAEQLAAGVLSAIKSCEDFFRLHKGHDFRHVEKDFDAAWDRCLNLAVAAAKVKRADEALFGESVMMIVGAPL